MAARRHSGGFLTPDVAAKYSSDGCGNESTLASEVKKVQRLARV